MRPLNFETLTETSELVNETLNFMFQIPSWNLKKSNLHWKLYFRIWFIFQIWCYYLVYNTKKQSLLKESSRKIEKIYEVRNWSFEVSVLSFILTLEVSDQSFEVRGEGGHALIVLTVSFRDICCLGNDFISQFWNVLKSLNALKSSEFQYWS